jgi:hypothetical protein
MRVVGFTCIRNGVTFDYPFLESILSLLPLVDEVVVAVGKSDDDTLTRINSLHSPKIKILETVWDESLRKGGVILSEQTNIALDQVAGDWAIYLQADEVLHEQDYLKIREALTRYCNQSEVEGFLFQYNHFYGNYDHIGNSRRWYRHEIRIIRPNIGIRSWADAQGFRIKGKKLHVKPIDATIYHYGWVKPPDVQQRKVKYFNKLWPSDKWVDQNLGTTAEYDYMQGGRLKQFDGTHPMVMKDRVRNCNWKFHYDGKNIHRPWKERILGSIESLCGWRIGEYKNYRLI